MKPSESQGTSPGEESSRIVRGENKFTKTPTTPCVLPILEGGQLQYDNLPLGRDTMASDGKSDVLHNGSIKKTLITGINDFVPEDILNSLTQFPSLPAREQLGPPSKHKRLKPLEVGLT